MKHLQAAALAVFVALVGASCSSSVTISIDEPAAAPVASAPDTPLPVELAAPETAAVADPVTQTAAALGPPQEKNEAAPYDQFVMATFAGASDGDFGILNFAVSAYCVGVLDSQLAAQLPIDQRWHDPLTSIDEKTCDEIEVHDFMIRTEPTGATSWDEAVRLRYERVVWWGGVAEFANHATRVCNDLPSSLDLDPKFELSTSAQIELKDMMAAECSLLFDNPASEGVVLEAGDVDRGFWLYYTAVGAEVEGVRQPRDLWRVHATTGEQQKLVDVGVNEHGGVQRTIEVSPDQSRIAYAINEGSDSTGNKRLGLFVANADGSGVVRVGDVADNSPFFWSDDGTEIVANDGSYDDDKFIVAFDVQDLSKRVVTEDAGRDLWLQGVVDGSIFYSDNDGNDRYRFYRADLDTGQELDVVDVGYVGWQVDPVTRTALFSDTSQEDIGRVAMIDLEVTPMQVVDIPTPHGFNKGPKISPDRRYIEFANGLEQFGNATSLVAALDAPEERIDVESVFTSGEGGAWMWAPDSRGLIVTNGEPWSPDRPRQQATMYLVSLDLEVIELGQGAPAAILAD